MRPFRSKWHSQRRRKARRGVASLYFLLFCLVTLPTMFLAIDLWRVLEGKVQQARFCDACAHAATLALTDETTGGSPYSPLLYGDPTDISTLCQTTCVNEAIKYAAMNFVDGVALALDTSTVNKDVKFGSFDFNAATPTFTLIDPTATPTNQAELDTLRSINAVRVEGFRTVDRKNAITLFGPAWTGVCSAQIVTRTTAALDRRVVGFRIQNNMAPTPTPLVYQTIPMAPVALLNVGAESWATQVETPADKTMTKIPYGTMTVKIPTSSTATPAKNAILLDIGGVTQAQFDTQILDGITSAQMAVYNPATSSMILDPSAMTPFTVNVPQFAAPAYDATMKANFETLMTNKTERVWPLYETTPAGADPVVVTGFVAALITAVSEASDDDGFSYITLTLQPTLIETPTAFTDYSNWFLKTTTNPSITNSGPPTAYAAYSRIVNPYICRVRLVD